MNGIVYLLRSPVGKGYVGITDNFDRRMRAYKNGYTKSQPLIHRAIQKYGWGNFEKFVLASGIRTKEALGKAEEFYIKKFDTLTPNGYNLASGGEYGGSHSAETRAKTSKALKGRPKPDGFGDTMSKALTGVPLSVEHKAKCSQANKDRCLGVPLSEEHKNAISKANTGVPLSEERKAKISFTQRFNAVKKKYAKCGWSGCSEDDYEWKMSTTVAAGQIVARETCN